MATNYNWIDGSNLPYNFYRGSAVIYKGEIRILGGYSGTRSHYAYNGSSWVSKTNLTYNFYDGCAVVYDDKIHILGGSGNYHRFLKKDESGWNMASTMPYTFTNGSAVVYNGRIHILGGSTNSTTKRSHWSFKTNENWKEESTLPYDFHKGAAVVYDGKIHIFGSDASSYRYSHYSWDGESWTMEGSMPYYFCQGAAVVYDNKVYLLGGYYNTTYMIWNGSNWVSYSGGLPYAFANGSAVANSDSIYLLGTNSNSSLYRKMSLMIVAYNIIRYGNKTLMDLTNLTLSTNDVKKKTKYIDKDGVYKIGTREPYYKYESSNALFFGRKKINSDPEYERTGILFNGEVHLRVSGTNIQLYGLKSDGVTESSITLLSGIGANYKYCFIIDRVHYINEMVCFISYRYQTSDTLFSGDYIRAIIRKYDGTLLLGSALQITAAPSTTSDIEYYLIRNLADNQYLWVKKTGTISSNSCTISSYKVYYTASSGAITYYSNSAIVNLTAGAAVRWPDFTRMMEVDRGGYFLKNYQGTFYFCTNYDYMSTNRCLTLSTSPDLVEHIQNPLNAHFLGMDSRGRVVIAEEISNDPYGTDYVNIYLFDYDNTVATNNFKYISTAELGGCHISPYRVLDADENSYKLPYSASDSVMVYFNYYDYLVGGTGHLRDVYRYEWGTGWVKIENQLPYDFKDGYVLATDYNGVYLLGSNGNGTKFYWANDFESGWTELTAIPYSFYQGVAFINSNGNVEIIGGNGNGQKHYEYNASAQSWTALTNFPVSIYNTTYYLDIFGVRHLIGSQGANRYHYYQLYDDSTGTYSWKKGSPLLYDTYNSEILVDPYNYDIHVFGGGPEYSKYKHARISSDNGIFEREYQGFVYRESDMPIAMTKPSFLKDSGILLDRADNTKMISYEDIKNITHIVSFVNNVITLSDGRRCQITTSGSLNILEPIDYVCYPYSLDVSYPSESISSIGPESDPYNGVCIY